MNFSNPLAEARLIISGKEVYVLDNAELVGLLNTPGQMHFPFPFTVMDLGQTVTQLRVHADQLKAA